MENEIDLFGHLDLVPEDVNVIIDKYMEREMDYDSCADLVKELNTVGYTCEYYLDAVPYGLKKL